jgi:hypothetical protein
MTWTTFATLTNPTTPELDANLAVLSALAPIPVTVSGTNALTLTSIAGASAISSYQNYMTFIGIAANTNSGGVTASVVGIQSGAFLTVYKDSLSGPVALIGGEFVQNCAFTLSYDSTLNSNAGGFHLVNSGSVVQTNQPIFTTVSPGISLSTLNASGQAGISIANGASASIGIGQGVLVVATNMSSTSSIVCILGGGGVAQIINGANWVTDTTTPSASNQSIAFDGSSSYRIYNNTGGTVIYKVITLRTG